MIILQITLKEFRDISDLIHIIEEKKTFNIFKLCEKMSNSVIASILSKQAVTYAHGQTPQGQTLE